VEVLAKRLDLRGDLAVPALLNDRLERRAGRLGRSRLGGGRGVDRRPVLRSDVVALTHALSRVVVLPEDLEQLLVRDLRRVINDLYDLGVSGTPGAGLLVGRVGGEAARVADRGAVDAGRLPEQPLRAPETAHTEDCDLKTGWPRSLHGSAEHSVGRG